MLGKGKTLANKFSGCLLIFVQNRTKYIIFSRHAENSELQMLPTFVCADWLNITINMIISFIFMQYYDNMFVSRLKLIFVIILGNIPLFQRVFVRNTSLQNFKFSLLSQSLRQIYPH